jgi:hypothetical protein
MSLITKFKNIIVGTINATAFITNGGASSNFVKGDGSLDSNTYLTEITSLITAATSETSPADANEIPIIVDGALKKLTWANLKAALKTYLDTLYVALTGDQTISGNKTFSGVMTATGQGQSSNLNDTSVITRGLLNVEIGGNGVCSLISVSATGGTQTTTQFSQLNGSIAFGSAPLAGQAALNVTYHPPNIIQSGSSWSKEGLLWICV